MDPCTGGRYSMDNAESMKMSYDLLKQITHDFSEQLGCGTYGMVFMGTNANGEEVAVKVLNDMASLDDKQFNNEFQNLAKLDHRNIVKLKGYCNVSEPVVWEHNGRQVAAEKLHVALCFEYVNNGSLGNYISDEKQGLHWHIRYKIIKGICEGLNYLHNGLQEPVLHLDLKPDNILLDKEMVPKIADFGLSRLIGDERTKQTMNKGIGTQGYLPPEYTKCQLLSPAFDIFSLGVIITKIMMGRESYHDIADMPPRKLVKHVHTNWKKRLQDEIVGHRSLLEVYCEEVKTCIEVASKCLMEDRQQRPKIQQIVATLNETAEMEQFLDGQFVLTPRSSITSVSASESGREASRSIHTERRSNCPTATPRKVPFSQLEDITDNFSDDRLIAVSDFAKVYKGIYEDGTIIAVKRLFNTIHLDDTVLQREVTNLYNAQHENIVELVCFCDETETEIIERDGRNFVVEIKNRALCLEYVQNGSLDRYIPDESCGLDWCTRYKIIKGICDGLRHLHEGRPSPIVHMNLKPPNILLDENMTPKIISFGLSRMLTEGRTPMTAHVNGSIGYMAPEYIDKGVISKKQDIYSLGVIMVEMITGYRRYREFAQTKDSDDFVELVHGKWRTRLQKGASKLGRSVKGYCQQLKRCILIALQCVEEDRHKRPDIGEVIRSLDETETWISGLLDVHPTDLHFTFKPKKHGSCLLQLHNKHDDHVAFRILSKSPKRYHTRLPLHGMVPPRCTYTLALMTSKQLKPPPSLDSDEGLVLWSLALSHSQELQLNNLSNQVSASREYENMFRIAQESADEEVQEVTLNCISAPAPADEEASSSDLTGQKVEDSHNS